MTSPGRPPGLPAGAWARMPWRAREKAIARHLHGLATDDDQEQVEHDQAVVEAIRGDHRNARIIAAYQSGKTQRDIAAAERIHPVTVYRVLRAAGEPRRRRQPRLPAADDCPCDGRPALYNAGHRCARVRAVRREREQQYQQRRTA